MSKEPPIHTWTERIDDKMIVGIASCFGVRYGNVYGLSVFVLHKGGPGAGEAWRGTDYWLAKQEARDRAEARLKEVVAKDHFGRLPPVGALRDLGGTFGVDMTW